MFIKLISILLVFVILAGCNTQKSTLEDAVISSISSHEITQSLADNSVPNPIKEYDPFDFVIALDTLMDKDPLCGEVEDLLKSDAFRENREAYSWIDMDWYEKLTQIFRFTLFDFYTFFIEDYENVNQQIQNPKAVSGYGEKVPILFPDNSAVGAVHPYKYSVSMRPPSPINTLVFYASDLVEEDRQLLAEDVFENLGTAPIIQYGEREAFFEYRYNSLRFRFSLKKDSRIINMVIIKRVVLYGEEIYEYDTGNQFEAVGDFSELLGGNVSSLTHDTLKEWLSLPSSQLCSYLNISGDDTPRLPIPVKPQYRYNNIDSPVNVPDIEGVYFNLSYAFESHFSNPERFANIAYFTMDFAALNAEGISMSMPLNQIMDKIGAQETSEIFVGDVPAVCIDYETEDFNFSFVALSETESLVYVVVSLR